MLSSGPPYEAAIDWDGIDDYDGSGSVNFVNLGDTITATCRILCNKENGYKVWFQSANFKTQKTGNLVKGSDEILYTASMDTSGVQNANIRTNNLRIKGNRVSLRVKFNKASNVLPLDGATQANVVVLSFTLASFDGTLYPAGTYTDTITATIEVQ